MGFSALEVHLHLLSIHDCFSAVFNGRSPGVIRALLEECAQVCSCSLVRVFTCAY